MGSFRFYYLTCKYLLICIALITPNTEAISSKCLWDFVFERFYPSQNKELDLKPIQPAEITEVCDAKQMEQAEDTCLEGGNEDVELHKPDELHLSIPRINNHDDYPSRFSLSTKVEGRFADEDCHGLRRGILDTFSLDLRMHLKPLINDWTSFILESDLIPQGYMITFALCSIALITAVFYFLELRSLQRSVNELMKKAAEQSTVTVKEQESEESCDEYEMFPESDDLSATKRPKVVTKVYDYLLQQSRSVLAGESCEDTEEYISKEFLRLIAKCIIADDFLKQNLDFMTPKSLRRLVKFYREINQKGCSGDGQKKDLNVNVGVYVDGAEVVNRSDEAPSSNQ